MRGRRLLSLLAAAALASALTGCVGTAVAIDAVPVDRCKAEIAVFGPLTGSSANLGRNIEDGVRLAVTQYDRDHPGCPVGIADFDSQGEPSQAPALAQQVVADPRILGVVGPAFSGESEAADPLLNQGGVATITPSATEAGLSARGWTTFHRILGSDAAQGPAAGRYLANTLRARKLFVIDDGGAYGHSLADAVIDVLGARVVQSESVLSGQTDFAGLIAQIRASGPDTIFYGGYYQQAGTLLRQLRAARLTPTFVAGDGVKDDGFLREAGPAVAEGTVITCSCRPPETIQGPFVQQYRDLFGRQPGTNSVEAYDAATVFLHGIGAGHLTRGALAAYVSAYDAPGVTATIRFTASGELVAPSVTVWAYRVRDGAIVGEQAIPQ
jgi:branched-chain amino acid transport system substrate-binding protein